MKKSLLTLLLVIGALMLFADSGMIWTNTGITDAQILRSSADGMRVRFNLGSLSYTQSESKDGSWAELSVPGYTFTNKVGDPQLPLLRKIISVPLDANIKLDVKSQLVQNIELQQHGVFSPLIPAQESVSKSADPATLPFIVNSNFYDNGSKTHEATLQVSELGMLRGERLFALDYVPVNYDHNAQSIDVVHQIEAEISFIGANHSATRQLKAKTFSPAFETVYQTNIWNYESRDMVLRHPISYVVITPQNFVNALEPFVEWKSREGYNVILSTIESIGNNYNSIRTYMQGLWNQATPENPAPSYLLIVGDVAQVATGGSQTSDTHPTDLHYVRLEGNDFFPEMYFGRFSATTPAQVTNQVNKTLMYAQFTMPDPSYLEKTVLIAGVDSYWATTHGNGQINYAVENYFNEDHGIDGHNFFYPQSGSNAANIRNLVSAGAGYVNYTAHGYTMEWSDPYFSNAQVLALQNYDMPSFVVGNCCLTSKFDIPTCFGEAWLRAENAGGVIYIGGTNSTYWHEDYWWSVGAKGNATGNAPAYDPTRLGMYDAQFHENGEAFDDWVHSAGAMIMMGNLAVVQGNSNRSDLYWEIYSIMGDPSVKPYAGIPEINDMDYPETTFIGVHTMDIYAEPYTYVALSMDNVLHGVGLTDANGFLELEFTPFMEPGVATLVATRSRMRPMIHSIDVVPNDGAYVTAGQIQLAGGAEAVEAGHSVAVNLSFSNVGIEAAENLSLSIVNLSPWTYATEIIGQLPDIAPNSTVEVESAFVLNIDQGTPDQFIAGLAIVVTDGEEEWITNRSVSVNAPDVIIDSVVYFDPNNNGLYEPGETINITLNATNVGHLAVSGGTLKLILNSDHASLPVSNFTVPGMNINGNIPLSFDMHISENAPEGEIIALGIALDMGSQMINHNLLIPIGHVMEGFESGDFSAFPWINDNMRPWTIDSTESYNGSYSAKSGQTTNNNSSTLIITANVSADGEISFARKVSSEANYDELIFSIDGAERGSWSGNVDWDVVTYPVTAGEHAFTWQYRKDISGSHGSDCAWIDDIRFPIDAIDKPIAYTNTTGINFNEIVGGETYRQNFVIRNLGSSALEGTISVPDGFNIEYQGVIVDNFHDYTASPTTTLIFTLIYEAPTPPQSIDSEILITTNDQDLVIITIPITARPTSSEDLVSPFVTALQGNYPNPFNPTTMIKFSLKENSDVSLNIYNLKGQLVRKLVNKELAAGNHQMLWDGKDTRGSSVSSGIYFYRMEAGSYKATQKMMLMK
ncbi:MAG TPA: T9SS type A sorting domain-containing protein [Candidatus Cloacimonetes bacterium]|nr:T9SS type A sorting domain-containing protein [Candidatus Cloacimonadota bacterium]